MISYTEHTGSHWSLDKLIRKTLTCLSIISSLSAFAGTMGPTSAPSYRPLIAGIGGYAAYNTGGTQSYLGSNFDLFTFNANNSNQGTGYGGVFVGFENALPWYTLFYQLGAEYLYYGSVNVSGTQVVGVDPATSSSFSDQYQFQTQQLMASLRLLTTVYDRFHPYFSVSIGGAWNSLSQYSVIIPTQNGINVPAIFGNNTQSQFTYSLGAGIDTDLTERLRLALGYRFSDFGQASFGQGTVVFNNFNAAVPFTLTNNHVQANAFFAQLSYIF